MGEGKILNSYNQGHWVDDNLLTVGNQNDFKNFEIWKNIIERFTNEFKLKPLKETNEFDDSNINQMIQDIPKFTKYFDIVNAKKYSKRIQSWKGIVTSKNEKTFIAKLFDLNIGGTYEMGEFDNEDVSPDDVQLLSTGAIFYWSVGHYMENGQSVKRSDIRFQRLITLDEDDIEQTKLNLERKYSKLKERKID